MVRAIKNFYHLLQAIVALVMYGFPARKMTVIGVTGTDGKTTTSSIIYHILREAGVKAALITSVAAVIDGKSFSTGFHVTTPGSFSLQKYIKKAQKAGIKYLVLEVSSHGLDQNRVFGVPFEVGIVTNIGREHLDYHKTYLRYVKAKAKLLRWAKTAVLNKDDMSYKYVKPLLKHKKVITYGFKNDSTLNLHNFKFTTKLLGKFNQYNSLAAIAALRQLHFSDDTIRKGLISFKAPEGRQEIVYNKEFMVIVDFAHTPLAFQQILPEVKKLTKNRLIHVFGAAARRDTYKRPEMGKLSSQYADIVIITAEDPRDEPIDKINNEIYSGMQDAKFILQNYEEQLRLKKGERYVFKIPDRKQAIEFAITLAEKGDVVLLTGKGHEKSMNYGRGEEPWDERKTAEEAIAKKVI